MKNILMGGVSLAAVFVATNAFALTLQEANARVSEAAEKPAVMAEVMQGLDKADQAAYVKSVNAAIAAMPVSAQEKTDAYLAASRAAVEGAKGNVRAILAEVFATVSVEALTVINEEFAKDFFNRNADPANPVDDKTLSDYSQRMVADIAERMKAADVADAAERTAFAALMFIRASEGKPEGLREELLKGLPEEAAKEWIPAALGEDGPVSYAAMTGASTEDSDAIKHVAHSRHLGAAQDAHLRSLWFELSGDGDGSFSTFSTSLFDPVQYALPSDMDHALERTPKIVRENGDEDYKWNPTYDRNETSHKEPGSYPGTMKK